MKKQYLILFLVVFCLGVIVTYPSFANSHGLDSYCTIYNGFSNTALWFLQNGRIFSALAFYIFDFIKIPFDSLSFVSSFFTNIFLALSIVKLYSVFKNNLDLKGSLKQSILIVCLFTLFYNPLFTEVLGFDESFVIALGILLMTLSVCKIYKGGILNHGLSLALMILAISCYQGIAVDIFPILLLLLFTNKKITITECLKKIGIALCIYGISYIVNFGIISLVSTILNESLPKTIELNIFKNILVILNNLMPNSIRYLFGFVDTNIYYLLVSIILGLIIYKIVKNDNKKRNLCFLIALILTSIIMPFIPNLFMSGGGYTAARMALILGALPSIFILYLMNFEIKYNYIILILAFTVFVVFSYSIHQNAMINFKRYKEDVKYIKTIDERIISYENKTKKKINEVYFAKDTSVNYYYSFGNPNGSNIRLVSTDWAMKCAVPVYTTKKYEYKKMSKKDYNKYFKNKNYDKFDKNELKVVGNKLYVLIY